MEDSALSDKGHPRAISLQKKVTIALFSNLRQNMGILGTFSVCPNPLGAQLY